MSIFSIFITIHIICGAVCLITGAIAASAVKRKGKRTYFGEIYHWTYVLLFISAIVNSIIHWNRSSYLFYIAIFSYALALIGYLVLLPTYIVRKLTAPNVQMLTDKMAE